MSNKGASASKRARETDILDLPNETLINILQYCDTVTAYKLGRTCRRLRTIADHNIFQRSFPLASACSPIVPTESEIPNIQLHPAILHAAWRPRYSYKDIQIIMGLRTFDLVGSGIEDQAATDPPISVCHVHFSYLRRKPDLQKGFQESWESRHAESIDSKMAFRALAVRDVLQLLVYGVKATYRRAAQQAQKHRVYRVPLHSAFLQSFYPNLPILRIKIDPMHSYRSTIGSDFSPDQFNILTPSQRLPRT